MGPKTIWVRISLVKKKKLSTKIKAPMALKKFGPNKRLVQKIFEPKKICSKRNFVDKN